VSDDVAYSLAARFSLMTVGLNTAVDAAMRSLSGLEGGAFRAEKSASLLQGRLDRAQIVSQRYASTLAATPTPLLTYQRAAERSADATARATTLTLAHTEAIDEATRKQQRLADVTSGANKILAGTALVGVGMAGVGLLKGWIDSAGQVQDALAQVGSAIHLTKGQMDDLEGRSYTIAGQTQFSAPQILSMSTMMARLGMKDEPAIAAALPTIARAAEVSYRVGHEDFQESVPAMVAQSHMLGALAGQRFIDNINLGVRARLASGQTTEQQNQVLRYINPARTALGISSHDIFELTALANQTGLTLGKGGSNLGALFRTMIPTQSGRGAHNADLKEIESIGGGQFFKGGQFVGFERWQQITNRFMDSKALLPEAKLQTLNTAFGIQGGQAAAVLSSDSSLKQAGVLNKKLAPYDPIKNPLGIDTVENMQLKLNQTMVGQMQTLSTNLSSISAMMGKSLVPAVTAATSAFVKLTGGFIALGQQHPVLVALTAGLTVLTTAATLAGGVILILKGAVEALGLGSVVGKAVAGVRALAASEAAATVATAALSAEGGILGATSAALAASWGLLTAEGTFLGGVGARLTAVWGALAGEQGLLALASVRMGVLWTGLIGEGSILAATSGVLAGVWTALTGVASTAAGAILALGAAEGEAAGGAGLLGGALGAVMPLLAAVAGAGVLASLQQQRADAQAARLGPGGHTETYLGMPIALPKGQHATFGDFLFGHQNPSSLLGFDASGWSSSPIHGFLHNLGIGGGAGVPYTPQAVPAHRTTHAGPAVAHHTTTATTHHHAGPTTATHHNAPTARPAAAPVTLNMGPGSIVVHGAAQQTPDEIAAAVWERIATLSGQESRRQGSTNTGWDLGYGGI